MAAQILSFAARVREPASRDWSRQELAEFYRVESALLQAGLALEGERGVSDEGDPWFVFCRVDTGEVFIHFARVDGVYIVDGAAFGTPARGRDFGELVRDLLTAHPLATVRRPGSNVMLHPAALLIALVGAAFFHSGKAHAAEPGEAAPAPADASRSGERRGWTFNAGGAPPAADAGASRAVALDASEVAAVRPGVAIGRRAAAEFSGATTAVAPAPSPLAISDVRRGTAARLDRTIAAADGSAALNALAGADARAALTVMAVFHDLARSAAPAPGGLQQTAAAAPVAAGVEVAAPVALASNPVTPIASAPERSPPVLMVHLGSGATPQIEALTMLTTDGALARVSPDRLVHVDQLPAFLADLIAHGDMITVGATTASGTTVPASSDASGNASSGATDASGAAAPGVDMSHGSSSSAFAVHGHTGDTSTDVAPPAAAPPSTAPATPPATTQAAPAATPADPHSVAQSPVVTHSPNDGDINAAVLAFVAEVPDAKVMISGHDVVFYDPAIMGVLQPGVTLDSVTWRLGDGSTVSLVGTQPELHAFHGVG